MGGSFQHVGLLGVYTGTSLTDGWHLRSVKQAWRSWRGHCGTRAGANGRASESIIHCRTSLRREAWKEETTLLECYQAPDDAAVLAVMAEPRKRHESRPVQQHA